MKCIDREGRTNRNSTPGSFILCPACVCWASNRVEEERRNKDSENSLSSSYSSCCCGWGCDWGGCCGCCGCCWYGCGSSWWRFWVCWREFTSWLWKEPKRDPMTSPTWPICSGFILNELRPTWTLFWGCLAWLWFVGSECELVEEDLGSVGRLTTSWSFLSSPTPSSLNVLAFWATLPAKISLREELVANRKWIENEGMTVLEKGNLCASGAMFLLSWILFLTSSIVVLGLTLMVKLSPVVFYRKTQKLK